MTGDRNSFFGSSAGRNNTTGAGNSFIGENAGLANVQDSFNSFVGLNAGTGAGDGQNTFIGNNSGDNSGNSDNNTFAASQSVKLASSTIGGNSFFGAFTVADRAVSIRFSAYVPAVR